MEGLLLTIKEASVNEVERLQVDPEFVDGFVRDENRRLELDKAWHGIHFLMTGASYEMNGGQISIMSGGKSLGALHDDYGPARALSADEIKQLYEVMAQITDEELMARYQAEKMQEVYPGFWEPVLNGEDFPYLKYYFEQLKEFLYQITLKNNGAVVFIN